MFTALHLHTHIYIYGTKEISLKYMCVKEKGVTKNVRNICVKYEGRLGTKLKRAGLLSTKDVQASAPFVS
jgi:hypothetical protein